ncbi:MAG TPA: pyruvate dehydrogenase complex dihydrolipoamide acetyltransferase, partial [Thermopetrobacter sp.]|nr:pyruvate dehydrogenase complex dihydrolipoamide acetyltransferase [Thermopetrobacter sp.]
AAIASGAGGAAAGVAAGAAAAGMSDAEILALYPQGSYDLRPVDSMRKAIASRLTLSKQTVPHFYLTVDCVIDRLLEARKALNAEAPVDEDGKPAWKLSVNDFVIKAWALALRKVPEANVTWTQRGMLHHHQVDVAVAVAIPGGLITPIIRAADALDLPTISATMKDLAARARARRLKPEEYQGGTTSISNLGMYGIREFAAVINPPQATLLAVGEGAPRVVAEDGRPVVRTVMTATLSADHRAVDGAVGAQALTAFRRYIEEPALLLFGEREA